VSCRTEYEVTLSVPGVATTRLGQLTSRSAARALQSRYRGSRITPIEVCDGRARRRGRSYGALSGSRRRRRRRR